MMVALARGGDREVPVSPESKKFLVELFTELRGDLNGQEEGAAEKGAIYDGLLQALSSGSFPDDPRLRDYVAGLAKATDRENGYALAVREHDALAELSKALELGRG